MYAPSLSTRDMIAVVFDTDLPLVIPTLYLSVATLSLLIYGVVYSTSPARGAPVLQRCATRLGIWSIFLTLLLVCNAPSVEALVLYTTQSVDTLSLYFQGGILVATAASLLCGLGYCTRTRLNSYEYVVLCMLASLGMMLLVSSQDLVGLYLAMELQSLCLYVLVAYARYSEFAVEAGLKYFVLGAVSSGLFLFGASLLYGATGTTHLLDMAQLLSGGGVDATTTTTGLPTCELGLVLLLVGLLFKLAAAPFHMWSPDVYEGAPTSVTAYAMMVPKVAFVGVLLRVLYGGFYDLMDTWQTVLVLSSALSMLVGAFGALVQTRLKRLLALSSVGHVGFMLAAASTGTLEGVQALVVYLVVYTLMNGVVFSHMLGGSSGGDSPRLVTDLTGLGATQPLVALGLCALWFSMAGIPPLAGFYSKAAVFYAAVAGGVSSLAVLGVLASVVSCFYYIRVIKVMYFEQPSTRPLATEMSPGASGIQALCVLCLVGLMAYPGPLDTLARGVALSVCG